MKTLTIATDFSRYPGLRNIDISDHSGEEFYHKLLNDTFALAYEGDYTLEVILDGTTGYAPSFLDEAFGNLIYDFGLDVVKKHLKIISVEEPSWLDKIHGDTYIQWETRRKAEQEPKTTKQHEPWYRLIDGRLCKSEWC